MKEKKEEDAKEKLKYYTGEQLNEPFTKEQFEEKWKAYLERLDDRPALKADLSKTPEIIKGNQLKLLISSAVQNEEITKIKPDLVSWLRKELKNTAIELITEIEANGDKDHRPYTESEKLQEMIKKNPNLKLLEQKFGLSLDE